MRNQAIALCRVSTAEQKLNNSLNRQEKSVLQAAKILDVEIIKYISGDVSSRVGKNVNRPDLIEAFSLCKDNKLIKYIIVDEVDRFMRSMGEMFYWITKFQQEAGVSVHFAANPELNSNDARARLLLSLDGFKAEGSNEERITKSINGHVAAIKEGRYTFPPKPGYMKGDIAGVHVKHPKTFKPLQKAFREALSGLYSPKEALERLMKTEFRKNYVRWDMDKFRRFAVDPYYAGILEIDAQVKARCEDGRHEKMVSKEEHEKLKETFNKATRPRKPNGYYNPEFPMNKLLHCEDCGAKFTGARKSNGHNRKTIHYYWNYRCRGCGKEHKRKEVHECITRFLDAFKYTGEQKSEFTEALEKVWKQKQADKFRDLKSLGVKIEELEETKSSLVIELARADDEYKNDIRLELDKIKIEIERLSGLIYKGNNILDESLTEFLKFGLDYTDHLKEDWWDLDYEGKLRCQQLLFSDGIYINSSKKVGTPKINPIYFLLNNKKTSENASDALMVELAGNAPASISLRR